MRKILVFSSNSKTNASNKDPSAIINIKKWEPSLVHVIPPNSSLKFILFWFAHYLRLFNNRLYCAYYIEEDNLIIASLICTPSVVIWPFMKNEDIQLKNVHTCPSYRGRGLAVDLINHVKNDFLFQNRTFWYLTHEQNFPSIRLCEKTGFELKGYYCRYKRRYLIIKSGVIKTYRQTTTTDGVADR